MSDHSGFTKISNSQWDCLLTLKLTATEMRVVYLMIRLTNGILSSEFARLRSCHLKAVNISQSHAKKVIESLLDKGVIEYERYGYSYRINWQAIRDLAEAEDSSKSESKKKSAVLKKLIYINLRKETLPNE